MYHNYARFIHIWKWLPLSWLLQKRKREFSDTNLRVKIGRNFANVLTECFSAKLKLVPEHYFSIQSHLHAL